MTLSELKRTVTEAYPENIWTGKVIRPLSCYPTWLFLKLGVSANQTTVLGIFLGVLGCILVTRGTYATVVWGALLLNLNYVMDRVDGNIARATNTTSTLGKLLDGFSDILLDAAIPVCVGVGLYSHPALGLPGEVYLLTGLVFALLRGLRSRITAYASQVTGERTFGPVTSQGILLKVGLAVVSLEPVVMLVFATAGLLSVFLLGYTLLALCELVVYIVLVLNRNKTGGTE